MSTEHGYRRRRKRGPGPKKRRGPVRMPLRHQVFEYGPYELRLLLEADPEAPLAPEDGTVADEELLSDESEVESTDEDAFSEREILADKLWTSSVIAKTITPGVERKALFDLHRYHALLVVPTSRGGPLHCTFEAPGWMLRPRSKEYRDHIARLLSFLRGLAGWIEANCQAFLRDPSPAFFAEAQGSFREDPVVSQKGLLQRVNSNLDGPMRVAEADFTRVLPKIWLVWPQQVMPLRSLFSDEFRIEWAASGALQGVPHGEWEITKAISLTKAQRSALLRKDFENLDREERLHFLSDRAKVKTARTSKAIRRRQSPAGGETEIASKPSSEK